MAPELLDVSSHETTIEVCAHRVTVLWWGEPLEDLIPILMEHAEDHIKEMILQNCYTGQLLWEDESRSIRGWWEIER